MQTGVLSPPRLPSAAVGVGAGRAHSVVLCDGGGVWAWGASGSGECGLYAAEPLPHPTRLALAPSVIVTQVGSAYTPRVDVHGMCMCMRMSCACACACASMCMCMRMSIRLHYRLEFDMHMSISFGRNSRGTLHYFTAFKYGLGPRNGPGRTRTSLLASKRQDTRQVMTPL